MWSGGIWVWYGGGVDGGMGVRVGDCLGVWTVGGV